MPEDYVIFDHVFQTAIRTLVIFFFVTISGAALTSAETQQLQEVYEETRVPVRLRLTLELLKKELAVCMLQHKLGKEVREVCDTAFGFLVFVKVTV